MKTKIIAMNDEDLKMISDKTESNKYLKTLTTKPKRKKYSGYLLSQIREYVTRLPSQELVVIFLQYWENLDDREIAKALACAPSFVRKTRQSALDRLTYLIVEDQEDIAA